MALIYKGDSWKISVNGRPMKYGDEITDPQEIADLTGQEGFEELHGGTSAPKGRPVSIVIDNPPEAEEPEEKEE